MIEVGVLDTDDGPVVIHAMRPARPQVFPGVMLTPRTITN